MIGSVATALLYRNLYVIYTERIERKVRGTCSSADSYQSFGDRGVVVVAVIEAGLALGCMNIWTVRYRWKGDGVAVNRDKVHEALETVRKVPI